MWLSFVSGLSIDRRARTGQDRGRGARSEMRRDWESRRRAENSSQFGNVFVCWFGKAEIFVCGVVGWKSDSENTYAQSGC